jgi:hypothetical protein
MRLWTLHPKYLDTKGLLAVWREALLAQKVLQNKTKGYKNHPQLIRFKGQREPICALGMFLSEVHKESVARNYNFDSTKILSTNGGMQIAVTSGQIDFELKHLKKKLFARNIEAYRILQHVKNPQLNALFYKVDGPKEIWEK